MASRPGWLSWLLGGAFASGMAKPAANRGRGVARGARADYDGATMGRRAAGWKRRATDANAELNPRVQAALRGIAHDLVRNNPFAASAVSAIADHAIGTGITFQIYRNGTVDLELTKLARAHFDTTACDSEGRNNLYGLQQIAARSIATSGAVIQRRRWRRLTDRLPVPFQIQMLEPDYIDMSKHGAVANGVGFRIHGIEFNGVGARSGYWLYAGHPGATQLHALQSKLVPAADIAHGFRTDRPEQQHGATWFTPVILRMKDFGDYEDAQLVRQKIAACFSVFRIASEETTEPENIGSDGEWTGDEDPLTSVEPGIIEDLAPGTDIKFASPPGVDGYDVYSKVSLHAICAGLGVPYEVVTGDLSDVSFISGRLGRLDFRRRVGNWQWLMVIPQLCEPAGRWFLEAAALKGIDVEGAYFMWTPPRFDMLDPATEVPAIRDAIRSGQQTISGAARERGEDPDVFLAEWAADAKKLDELGLIFDSDPRKVTSVGNAVQSPLRTDPAKGK